MSVKPNEAHDVLSNYILKDGYEILLDMEKSSGAYIHDSISGKDFLDFFTFFASNPLGMNHPDLLEESFIEKIKYSALNKPSNSDVYTVEMASFIKTFGELAATKNHQKLFFVSGGALAVENALKAAFDWKVKKNFIKGYTKEVGHKVLHFEHAFHGRSGYTLSLTNTDPQKVKYFPKFDWPRVSSPGVNFPINEENLAAAARAEAVCFDEIKAAINDNPDDIAAILIEPIQCEGGDIQFRKEFFEGLRKIADDNEILLIFDEVQTGMGMTGKMWCFEHYGIEPDMFTFGKKSQVCGFASNNRIDDIENNVFKESSRINSTFGGNLVDMVRCEKYLEIMAKENLVENAKNMGIYLLAGLTNIQEQFPEMVSNVRGRGLICAFDLTDGALRDKVVSEAFINGMIVLGCGTNSIRFRPRLNVTENDIDEAMRILFQAIKAI